MTTDLQNSWLRNPGPHKLSSRQWVVILFSAIVFIVLWLASQGTYSEQPRAIKPAPISNGQGLQAIVRVNSFNAGTNTLALRVQLKAIGGLIDSRGILTENLTLRIVDDLGANQVSMNKGDPLTAQEVNLETDGDVTQYPFDKYKGEFSLLAEIKHDDGTFEPLKLSVGTAHAETGWFTRYTVSPEASDEAKVTIVAMHREPFHIAFAVILALLILMLAAIALLVGYLCITNRRTSDPGVVGWLGGLLFSMPFVRRIMPGDPPIGCALDVKIFVWSLILCTFAILLAMIAWLRQSKAAHEGQDLNP